MSIVRALRLVLVVSCAGLVGSLAGARPVAAAVPFAMSGQHRKWCCSKLALSNPPSAPVLPTSIFGTGYLTFAGDSTAFPGGALLSSVPRPGLLGGYGVGLYFGGLVSQTGLPMTSMDPATLTLPSGALTLVSSYVNPSYYSTYLATSISLSNAQATFMAGAGPGTPNGAPGSYSFCRAAGTPPAVTPCSVPPGAGGVGDPAFPWQIRVRAGRNRFGGTMQLLGKYWGVAKYKPPSLGGVNRNVYFSFVPNSGQAIPAIDRLTAVVRFTLSGEPIPCYLPIPYCYASYFSYSSYSHQTAAPLTTGTISVRVTNPASPFLYKQAQATGYDNRTANGQGNIQLVTPVVITGTSSLNPSSNQSWPLAVRYRMTLPEPGGAIALGAGVAALFGIERLRRRRQRRLP